MALTESELSSILDREQRQAISYMSSELTEEREDALKRFYGEPYGTEEDGRSKVVMRDVQDVVEWLLPALLKIFSSGDQVVEFQPRGPEDEEQAKQRTEYINYVFQQDNNGFLCLYTAFKDCLIQKNGVVKVYYDPHALDEVRTVEGIDDEAYTLLIDDPDIEIIEHTEYADETSGDMVGPYASEAGGAMGGMPVPIAAGAAPAPVPGALPDEGVASQVAPMVPPTMNDAAMAGGGEQAMGGPAPTYGPALLHDVKYRKSGGKVCVENVPPENWLLSRRCTHDYMPYVADRKRKTISELITEGLVTKAEAESLALGSSEDSLSGEAETRATIDDEGDMGLSDREGVMREVWVTDHYILVDYDEDGIAERRRIVTAGATSNILLNEEWEGPPPYASGSPILVPHRVIGQSIADQVSDLQLINTTIMRQVLDNLYRTNNPRFAGTDAVDQDDWYSPNPGQLVHVDGNPNDNLREIVVPFTAQYSLQVMEYIQTLRENRTGVTRYNQGIDANSLNKTASGITQIMSAAQQRVELIARILAETFVKDLFRLIDHCVTKYQNKERIIRIRNEWVPVDPRQWESNFDMTINVGLGTGNKDQQLMHLQNIAMMQEKIIMMQGGVNGPLVTMDNVYATIAKIIENAGLKNVEAFLTDPKKAEPQPPKPDPNEMKVQAEIAAKMKMTDAEIAAQAKKTEADIALKRATTVADYELKFQGQQADVALAGQKNQSEIAMSKERMNGEAKLKADAASSEIAAKSGVNIQQGFDQMMQALAAMAQAQAAANAQLSAQLQQVGQLIAAEKEVVRGPDGRAMGVRIKQQSEMVQ